MAGKTAGDGSKPYANGGGTRPYKGAQTTDPNMPPAPTFVKSSDRDIEKMPVPRTNDHAV